MKGKAMKKTFVMIFLILSYLQASNLQDCNIKKVEKNILANDAKIILAEVFTCKKQHLLQQNLEQCFNRMRGINSFFNTRLYSTKKQIIMKNLENCILNKKIKIKLRKCNIQVIDIYNNQINVKLNSTDMILFGSFDQAYNAVLNRNKNDMDCNELNLTIP